jgi:hypothetical protein
MEGGGIKGRPYLGYMRIFELNSNCRSVPVLVN